MYSVKKFAGTIALMTLTLLGALVFPVSAQMPYGGTIVVGVFEEPSSVNVLSKERWINYMVCAHTYDTLFSLDSDFNTIPCLAKRYEVSKDAKTWTFYLVDNAVWHDGRPVTSADVKFTIEYLLKGKYSWLMVYVGNIQSVETPDKYTVVIKYKSPNVKAPYDFSSYSVLMMPEHVWKDIPTDKALTHPNMPMVGSGPWKFEEWKTGQYIRFSANEKYWGGRAYIDTMIWKFFPVKAVGVDALKVGEVDLLARDIPGTAVKSLMEAPDIKVTIAPGGSWRGLTFNCNPNGTGNPTLLDRVVRKALSISIDRELLVRMIHLGYFTPTATFSLHPVYSNRKIAPEFNLTKAADMLTKAGYIDRNGDGIRESPKGVKMEYQFLVVRKWEEEARSGEMIKTWWNQIGVGVKEIRLADAGTLDSLIYPKYNFDLFLWGWPDRPDPSWIFAVWLTNQIGGMNEWGYSNPKYDELYLKQEVELDPQKRKEMLWEMQQIVYDDSPAAILYNDATIVGHNLKKFSGFVFAPGGLPSPYNTMIQKAYSLTVKPVTTTATTAATTAAAPSELLSPWTIALLILVVCGIALVYIVQRRGRGKATSG